MFWIIQSFFLFPATKWQIPFSKHPIDLLIIILTFVPCLKSMCFDFCIPLASSCLSRVLFPRWIRVQHARIDGLHLYEQNHYCTSLLFSPILVVLPVFWVCFWSLSPCVAFLTFFSFDMYMPWWTVIHKHKYWNLSAHRRFYTAYLAACGGNF